MFKKCCRLMEGVLTLNVPGPGSTESLATPVTVSRSREGRSLASLGM